MTTTGEPYESRGEQCEFEITTTMPEGYTEIGTVDVTPGGYGHNWITDISRFKEEIRPHVCRAGGQAAVAFANGHGLYIKAAILRKVEAGPSPASSTSPGAAAAADASADSGTAAATSGCQFDTQCKGDRICVDGKCVNPT